MGFNAHLNLMKKPHEFMASFWACVLDPWLMKIL